VTEVFTATAFVVMVKLALVDPAGTVTLAGTGATVELLLCNVTTAPPLGAATVKFTVAVEEFPPTRELGFRVRDVRDAGAVMVRVAVRLTPRVPVMTDEVFAVTAIVVATNVADVPPAGTVNEPGT
jgi:hypothetical protein